MKITSVLLALLFTICSYGQTLSIDFESGITTEDFIDFDGGMATVIDNPNSDDNNSSNKVAQIVRDGGEIWAGSKIDLANNLDFSIDNMVRMKVFTSAPIGTVVKFKLEGDGSDERDAVTTVSNAWEELTWDFTGTPNIYNSVVFMFDFGNTGNGSTSSTFLFDDVTQASGGEQIDWPADFEGDVVNHTVTDFGGNVSTRVIDPTDESNYVIQSIKTDGAAAWAGTTIGTPAGFATNLPLALDDSKMTVRVWSPTAGTPIRLKVEDSTDPTHTCETETNTTVSGWELLEFDFNNQAPGTESLAVGLQMGWTYNMASLFFNFGTEGSVAGEQTYYFDEVRFGDIASSTIDIQRADITISPNPTAQSWNIKATEGAMNQVTIYTIDGLLLRTYSDVTTYLSIDASQLNNGFYIAKINSNLGQSTVRLVKN